MAVLLTKIIDTPAGRRTVRYYDGDGTISEVERERALLFDEYLKEEIARISEEMQREPIQGSNTLKWYRFGQELLHILSSSLVDPNDISTGRIWKAIRQYATPVMLPSGSTASEDASGSRARREGRTHDHFEFCYQIAQYDEPDIRWISRWSDWITITESPALLRDKRIVRILGEELRPICYQMSRNDFRRLIKELRKYFTTKSSKRDTEAVDEEGLRDIISKAIITAGLGCRG